MEHIYKCRSCKQTFIETIAHPRTYEECPRCGGLYWDWLNWPAISGHPQPLRQGKKKRKRRRKR